MNSTTDVAVSGFYESKVSEVRLTREDLAGDFLEEDKVGVTEEDNKLILR